MDMERSKRAVQVKIEEESPIQMIVYEPEEGQQIDEGNENEKAKINANLIEFLGMQNDQIMKRPGSPK